MRRQVPKTESNVGTGGLRQSLPPIIPWGGRPSSTDVQIGRQKERETVRTVIEREDHSGTGQYPVLYTHHVRWQHLLTRSESVFFFFFFFFAEGDNNHRSSLC